MPARVDLFAYDSGYAWGYAGSGPQALSYALAGQLADAGRLLLERIIRRLSVNQAYLLLVPQIVAAPR